MRILPSPSSNSDPLFCSSSPVGKSYIEALRRGKKIGWPERRLTFERSWGIWGGCNYKRSVIGLKMCSHRGTHPTRLPR